MKRTFIHIPRSQGTVAAWKPPRTRDALQPSADRSGQFLSVVDQGDHGGACVYNSGLALVEFTRRALGLPDMGRLSRLFSYYNAMVQEAQGRAGHAFADGTAIKSLMDSLTTQGYCREALWGYSLKQYHTQPRGEAYAEAFRHRIPTTWPAGTPAYSSLGGQMAGGGYDLNLFKQSIAFGHCFVFAFIVWDGLNLKDGILTPPLASDPINAGMDGHAVVAVGYDDARQAFKCRNSWGASWGDGTGHFWFPYSQMKPDRMFDPFTIEALRDL